MRRNADAPGNNISGVNLSQSLHNWAGLQGIGKKPRTKKYHTEIVKLITDYWPGGAIGERA
jgi:hypothetical protein